MPWMPYQNEGFTGWYDTDTGQVSATDPTLPAKPDYGALPGWANQYADRRGTGSAEDDRYLNAFLSRPDYLRQLESDYTAGKFSGPFANAISGLLGKDSKYGAGQALAGTLGQMLSRPDFAPYGTGTYDQMLKSLQGFASSMGFSGDNAGVVKQQFADPLGYTAATVDPRAASIQNYNTAAAQASRDVGGLAGLGPILPLALGIALGPAGLGLTGASLGAATGGLVSALTGGDVAKGALSGGLSAGFQSAIGSGLSGMLDGVVSPSMEDIAALSSDQIGAMEGGQMADFTEAGMFDYPIPDFGGEGMWSASDLNRILGGEVFPSTPIPGANMAFPEDINSYIAQSAIQQGIPFSAAEALATGQGFLPNYFPEDTFTVSLPDAGASAGVAGAGGLASLAKGILGATPSGQTTVGGIPLGGLLGTGANLLGGYLNSQAAKDAAQTSANAQIEAARIAAEASKFKPVGVTTRFGQSNFGYDDKGNLTSAGYTLSPEVKALQDQLMGASGGMLSQFLNAPTATAPMGTAAQRAMALGQGYLAGSPEEQAAQALARKTALINPQRERELAALENRLMQQGRLGLATGGTSTLGAANPEMEAFFNAQRMQDLSLAEAAQREGQQYATFGAGLVGTGGDLLRSMYGTQTAAYAPFQTTLGGAQTIEQMGQQPLDIGTSLGQKVSTASAGAGSALASGMTGAANTQLQAAMQAGSPWGNILQGASGLLNQQMPTYDPGRFRLAPL